MALTANEQKIIKYIGENYTTKSSIAPIAPAYAVGDTSYSSTWLSKTIDGSPLIPIQNRFYFVCNVGKIYTWDNTEKKYVQANLPDTLTAQEVSDMWL